MKRIPLFLPLLALASAAPAANPAPERLPDAAIRVAGKSALGEAVRTLESILGATDVLAPLPTERLEKRVRENCKLHVADGPAVFLWWMPADFAASTPEEAAAVIESIDGPDPGQLMILPVEEKDARDYPELALNSADAVFARNGLLFFAEGPDACAFATNCVADGLGALRHAPLSSGGPAAVVEAGLREPFRFAPFRTALLSARAKRRADLAKLRERCAAGEDVADELRWAEHMEGHAGPEEAIGDLLFSLLDANAARLSLDCDAERGLVLRRVLEGPSSPATAFEKSVPLAEFATSNFPFLSETTPEDAPWRSSDPATRIHRERRVGEEGAVTDLWTFPPTALRAIRASFRTIGRRSAPPPAAAPAPASAKPDTDADGLRDGDEVDKYRTDPLNPDTDGDGLTDGAEVLKHRTDPCNPDTDADGLRDGDEVDEYRTNPLNPDTDGDGLTDGAEVLKHKTDPLDRATQSPAVVSDGIAD